jgi:hypothetical protein
MGENLAIGKVSAIGTESNLAKVLVLSRNIGLFPSGLLQGMLLPIIKDIFPDVTVLILQILMQREEWDSPRINST